MVRRLRQELYRHGGIDLWMVIAASAIAVLMIVVASEAQGQTFQVLHTFTNGADGGGPEVGLTIDRAGNLYGTAQYRRNRKLHRRGLEYTGLRHGLQTKSPGIRLDLHAAV